jgi:amino acid transporter
MGADPATQGTESPTLRRDALGLLGTISLTAAYMAPAASLIALFGPIVGNAGIATGFVMLLGLLVTLPSAISFGMMARELPSAGGVYAWARASLGEGFGRWVGLVAGGYYVLTMFFPPIVFGQLVNSLITQLGGEPSLGTWVAGAGASLVIAAISSYRGIAVSSMLAFAMLLIQLAVMSGLVLTLLVAGSHHGTLSAAPFLPPAGGAGWGGLLLALPLVLLSLACDAATPASEETSNASRTIPLAILLTLVLVGGWNVIAFGAMALALPPDQLVATCRNDLENALPAVASTVWGQGRLLITLVGMSAMIGALVPCATAASRLVYCLGREELLPGFLGRVHARRQTPANALHVVFAATALATILPGCISGPTPTITLWGNVIAFYMIAVYFITNLCSVVYYRRFSGKRFSLAWNLLVPAVAMTSQLWIIWRVLVNELWNSGVAGRSAQAIIVLSIAVTAVYAVRKPPVRPGTAHGDATRERAPAPTTEIPG